MKRLRSRIIRLFETSTIADDDDGGGSSGNGKRQKLEYLVRQRNGIHILYMYIRHSVLLCYYIYKYKKNRRAIEQIAENTS
jgi:hypothetical protein